MHVSVTRVKTHGEPIENATIVGEEMLRWLREMEGFEGFLVLSREGQSLGLTFWASEEIAQKHRVARMKFLERMAAVARVEVEEGVGYELMFADLGPLVADATR